MDGRRDGLDSRVFQLLVDGLFTHCDRHVEELSSSNDADHDGFSNRLSIQQPLQTGPWAQSFAANGDDDIAKHEFRLLGSTAGSDGGNHETAAAIDSQHLPSTFRERHRLQAHSDITANCVSMLEQYVHDT